MAFGDRRAEFGERLAMRFSLALGSGDAGGAIGDLRRTAIAVTDRDQPFDVMELHRSAEVVPERRSPRLELWRDNRDCRAGNDELAVPPGKVALVHVLVDRRHHSWVNAGEEHGLVIALPGFRREWSRCHEPGASQQQKAAPAQPFATARSRQMHR